MSIQQAACLPVWMESVDDKTKADKRSASLDIFLAKVERRAFVMAEIASGNPDDALDLVQDAMMAFASRYGNKPSEEWPPLFYRVLQNRIRDWHRRRQVRNRWLGWLGRCDSQDEDAPDPIQTAADPHGRTPEQELAREQAGEQLVAAIEALPLRQQQAYLLRQWEGLDVADTAKAMGCSSGSVKTHLSRAMLNLRNKLAGHRL